MRTDLQTTRSGLAHVFDGTGDRDTELAHAARAAHVGRVARALQRR